MKNPINKEHIEGYVYEHKLAIKEVQNKESDNFGKPFIGGTIDIATDEACTNVLTVHFTFVTEKTKKGNKNATYAVLKNIIDSGKTVLIDGKDAATKVRIDTALALNDFYSNRDGDETLVSVKTNEGGFVGTTTSLAKEKRNSFEVDMYINKVAEKEANPERGIAEDYLVISGYVFNFRKSILPVDLICKDKNGMKYFLSKDITKTQPMFTRVWGDIVNASVERTVTKESAWGGPVVEKETHQVKEWRIAGCQPVEYILGDEEAGITSGDLEKALADREVYLAEVKRKNDEYQASKSADTPGGATAPAAAGGFAF